MTAERDWDKGDKVLTFLAYITVQSGFTDVHKNDSSTPGLITVNLWQSYLPHYATQIVLSHLCTFMWKNLGSTIKLRLIL
jgi:hypothetical protein